MFISVPARRDAAKRRKIGAITRMAIEHPVFTPAEIEAIRADDRSAAAAIVGLMAGIFALGLVGYLAVCVWVG
jgi:hypothetical protein